MRAAVVAVLALTTCAPRGGYLADAQSRRETLERSLSVRDNAYARLRLLHYGRDWDSLPVWNPSPAIVVSAEASAGDERALRDLGETAFFAYPAQLAFGKVPITTDMVRVELANGQTALSFTCASCHVRSADGVRIVGAANDRLDLGRALVERAKLDREDPEAALFLAWGPGRIDVTTGDGHEPVRIPDLRPTRFLSHLHHSGAVAQFSVESLAIRIETQIVVAHDQVIRPPREIALGLAQYVWSLADSLPELPIAPSSFTRNCSKCHGGEGLSGGLVSAGRIGTDSTIARSLDRGTGSYRVPSLRGVGSRGALLHDASIASLEAMFDRTRKGGHRYGLDLDEQERSALLGYLHRL